MTNDGPLLMRAIAACPDEDTPRLAYADFLQENGGRSGAARAKFIRLQCESARLPDGDRQRLRTESLAGEIEVRYAERWSAPLHALGATAVAYARGMPAWVEIPADDFIRNGEEIVGRFPVRGVHLTHLTAALAPDLAATPALARVRLLDLSENPLGPDGAAAIAGSPHLSGVETMSLARCGIGSSGASALAAAVSLGQLRRLDLAWNDIGPDGAVALASSRVTAEVRQLDLDHNVIADTGAVAIAHSPHLRGLESLSLASNRLSSSSVEALLDSPVLAGVRRLGLAANDVGDAGAVAIAQAPHAIALEELRLGLANIGNDGVIALAGSPFLGNLRTLALSGNDCGDEAAVALARGALSQLESLALERTGITEAGAAALRSANRPRLNYVRVSSINTPVPHRTPDDVIPLTGERSVGPRPGNNR